MNWQPSTLSARELSLKELISDSDFCHFHGFTRTECQLDGRDYRCHVDFSVDGPDYGGGAVCRYERFRVDEAFLKSFLITTAFSVTTATVFFLFLPSLRRSRNCWRVRHRPFMTFSSHFSADLPEWLPSLPRRKEM